MQIYLELQKKNKNLQTTMNDTRNSLLLKKQELNELSDSLAEIETMIGIAPVADTPLQERVNLTKLNSEHMATLLQLIPSGSPIEYKGITSKFGYRIHPTLNRREFHRGSDMRAKMNTPVYATADGIVEYAGLHKKSGFGKLVNARTIGEACRNVVMGSLKSFVGWVYEKFAQNAKLNDVMEVLTLKIAKA